MSGLASALSVGGIGRIFFAHVALCAPAPGARDGAAAIAMLEAVLGEIVAIEARRTAAAVIIQSLHAGDAVAQLLLRQGPPAEALEADGTEGSLRLAGGTLHRHRPGSVDIIPIAEAGFPVAEASVTRLLAWLERVAPQETVSDETRRGTTSWPV